MRPSVGVYMDKKILFVSLIVLSVFAVSGCTSSVEDCVSKGVISTSLTNDCCEGLSKVPNCIVRGDGTCNCDANKNKRESVCVLCGDGTCQPDENKCSCPDDCVGDEKNEECEEGAVEKYMCPNNRTEIEWCFCQSSAWYCPLNPAEACLGHGTCRNESDCDMKTEFCVDGICTPFCKGNYTSDCVGGNLWWFNSCGVLGEMKENCSAGCINGVCIGCKAEDHIDCYGNDVWWFDSCDVKERIYTDCLGTCNLGGCCEANVTDICYQGDIHWVDSCNYTQDTIKENCTAGHGCYTENTTCVTCDDHVYFTCINGDSGDLFWFNSCGDRQEIHTSCDQGCDGISCLPDCIDPDVGEPDPSLNATTVTDRHGLNRTDVCEDDRYLREYYCTATHDADYAPVIDCGATSLTNCTAGACTLV